MKTEWTEKCKKKDVEPRTIIVLSDLDNEKVRKMRQSSIKRLLERADEQKI